MLKFTPRLFKILIISFLCMGNFRGFSQDLVVITNQDSINCRIMGMNDKGLTFLAYRDSSVIKVTYPSETIVTYVKGYFSTPEIPEGYEYKESGKKEEVNFFAGGGYGRIFGNPSSSSSYRDFRHGFYLNIGLRVILNSGFGFGFKYSFFRTEGLVLRDFKQIESVVLMNFIGGELSYRIPMSNGKDYLIISGAPGYIAVNSKPKDKDEVAGKFSSGGFSLEIGFVYQFYLRDNFYLGLLMSGNLNTGTVNSLSRLNIGVSVGFR